MTNKDKINLNEMELDQETLDLINGGGTDIGPNTRIGRTVSVTDVQVCPDCGCTEVTKRTSLPAWGIDICRCKGCNNDYGIRTKQPENRTKNIERSVEKLLFQYYKSKNH